MFNDETGGALNKTGLSLSYAHKVVFSESELYFGVSGGAAKINISNISDPAIVNSEDIYPEVLFGAYFKKNDFTQQLADAETDEVLGAHMIGPRVADMISEIAMAMEFRASAEDIARVCHAHPTTSEVTKEAALAATENRALHS